MGRWNGRRDVLKKINKLGPKSSTMLPAPGVMNNIGRSKRTVQDYSKVTPLTLEAPTSLLTQFAQPPSPKKK